MKKLILVMVAFSIIAYLISHVSASPFIAGYVNNSFYQESANGHKVIIWKSTVGMIVNATDIIGSGGNSEADNFFMIDCQSLNNSCDVGDVINIKVVNSTYGSISNTVNITISGAGYEMAPNLMINSKPNVSINSPINWFNGTGQILFNCSASDLDGNLENISIYSNFSGIWKLNDTKQVTGYENTSIFTISQNDGKYGWKCEVNDNLALSNNSENRTVIFDNTPPLMNDINVNESLLCGTDKFVKVNCNVSDSLTGVREVLIEATSNTISSNFSTTYISGLYSTNLLVDETGKWNFSCIASDYSGNRNVSEKTILEAFLNLPNLFFDYIDIIFSKNNPIEDEEIIINVTVKNNGCTDANNLTVGFFEGNPNEGKQISINQTGSVPKGDNQTFNVLWNSKIGLTNIYVISDINESYIELNETDNFANRSINVFSWHTFYGNITADRVLENFNQNLSIWLNDTNSSGNVYVTDIESNINWASLMGIGNNISGNLTQNDFLEMDICLGSSNYIDSISKVYTSDGNTPINRTNFLINNREVNNVPSLNSTINNNFFTGILWDFSDDTNGEYDVDEKEDIVFITKINRNTQGSLGIYDYEIKVPSKLREYNPTDNEEVFIYFDLI